MLQANHQHTNKYIKHVTSKPITTTIRENGTDEYEHANIQAFAIEPCRMLNREPSILRTFCRLKTCVYKSAWQSGRESEVIQTVWCEVALACENLTNKYITYKTVMSRTANGRVRRLTYKCDLQKVCKQIRIAKEKLLLYMWYKFEQCHIYICGQ